MGLVIEVLDDLSGAGDGGQGSDVVERSIRCEEGRIGRRKKPLVGALESHLVIVVSCYLAILLLVGD